jgi:2-succinyl-5-enolpyruvyl-6-hydroxy-3-cyclohexene-1-carboxylate synthase
VGKPGLSRAVQAWLRSARRQLVVDPYPRWADPARSASSVIPAVPHPSWAHQPAPGAGESAWLLAWRKADDAARAAVDAVLDAEGTLSEPRVARDLGAALPAGSLLFAGSSRPVRDLDAYGRPGDGVRILGNRGASGIDGSVSTAVGAALAHQRAGGGPAYALIGDLAYLHDRNGLVLGPDEPRPDLTIVVVDNDGGGIFSQLPQAGAPGFERVFGTPHGVDLAADAVAVGVPYREVRTPEELVQALRFRPGLRVIRVHTDRGETAALHRRLQAAVTAALRFTST